jgi:hypothetical protein
VTKVNVKEEITERITNSGEFYQLVRNILWKWEMLKRKICLFKLLAQQILVD